MSIAKLLTESITHVKGHIVQPQEVAEVSDVETWTPKQIAIGVNESAGLVYVAVTGEKPEATLAALTASVLRTLGSRCSDAPPQKFDHGCVVELKRPTKPNDDKPPKREK